MDISLHVATPSNRDFVVECVLMAGDGLFEQIFEGAYQGLTAEDAMKMGMMDREMPYFIENSTVAVSERGPEGCIMTYPSSEYGLPDVVTSMIPAERLAPLGDLFARPLPESLYINTVAVRQEARGQGVAGFLLSAAEAVAIEKGFDQLTLHVWADNYGARNLYRRYGFEEIHEHRIPNTEYLHHDGPMILMQAPVSGLDDEE